MLCQFAVYWLIVAIYINGLIFMYNMFSFIYLSCTEWSENHIFFNGLDLEFFFSIQGVFPPVRKGLMYFGNS